MDKLNEYVQTGTLRILEREKTNPINILGEIYGVGPVKAKQLVEIANELPICDIDLDEQLRRVRESKGN